MLKTSNFEQMPQVMQALGQQACNQGLQFQKPPRLEDFMLGSRGFVDLRRACFNFPVLESHLLQEWRQVPSVLSQVALAMAVGRRKPVLP